MAYMIFPYSSSSKGAKDIAEGLGGMRIRRENSTYVWKQGDVVINWGASDNPFALALNANNKSVLSKSIFFDRLKYQNLTPRFATTREGAIALGCKLVCRQKDQGKDGAGIVIWDGTGPLPDAKLFVELIPKTEEYRVHVGRTPDGEVVLIGHQKKIWKSDGDVWAGPDCSFVWTVNGLPVLMPSCVRDVAKKTLEAIPELTFAGLDIVYDNDTGKAFVLEANSAPMMTPKTVDCYVNFFTTYYPSN